MEDEVISAFLDRVLRDRALEEAPPYLYKFVSTESRYFQLAMHELFLHGRLFLSSRQDLNDPFDTWMPPMKFETVEQVSEYVSGVLKRGPEGIKLHDDFAALLSDPAKFGEVSSASLGRVLDSAGIYSLTESIAHPLMWAHYGCSYRGIALMFDIFAMSNVLPVDYVDERPPNKPDARGLDIPQLLAKGTAWRYEREWRMVEPRRARTWVEIAPTAFKGIVLGARRRDDDDAAEFLADLLNRRRAAGMAELRVLKTQAEGLKLAFYELRGAEWVGTSPP